MRISPRRVGMALAGTMAAALAIGGFGMGRPAAASPAQMPVELPMAKSIPARLPLHRAHNAILASRPHLPLPPPHPLPPPALPLAPAHGTLPGWLHTQGTWVVDAANRHVRLDSINWYGSEGSTYVPGGLEYRPYMDILRTIKYLGFNSIRLPFSNELVERNPIVRDHLDANPQLRGKHALHILDAVIDGAHRVGLMVILVDMGFDTKSADTTRVSDVLWYKAPRYPQSVWIRDWLTVAQRYRNNPAVVGADLHNEPHSNGPGLEILGLGYLRQGSTWGPFRGVDNPATDWRLAAQQAGNAILRVNPHLLIIVEGTEIYPYVNPLVGSTCPYRVPATNGYCADVYWWGGNLAGAKDYPVVLAVPHHLVYSPHEYGPNLHDQRWISPSMTEQAWQLQMYKHWAYLADATGPNAAPVWLGEFGTYNRNMSGLSDPRGNSQGHWFSSLVHLLQRYPNIGWAYWPLNGTRPGSPRRLAQPDSYGLLGKDWRRLSQPKLFAMLRTIER